MSDPGCIGPLQVAVECVHPIICRYRDCFYGMSATSKQACSHGDVYSDAYCPGWLDEDTALKKWQAGEAYIKRDITG